MRKIAIVSALSGTTVLAGLMLASPSVFSEVQKSVNTTVTVETACSIASLNDSTEYSATLDPDSMIELTGSTLKAVCNDAGGLAVYAVGFGGDTLGGTDLVNTTWPDRKIATGTATSGNTSAWAMKLTSGVGSPTILNGYGDYNVVPSVYTKVLSYGAGTDIGDGVQATASYRIYAAGSQTVGTYIGKVKYTMVHPESAVVPISLEESYGMAGKTKYNGYYKMQDMTTEICNAATLDEVGMQAIDTRDDKIYSIAKLKDGNCWMTQNLDHNIDSTKTYTSSDTDIPADWTPSLSTYAAGDSTWNYSATTPNSYDPGNLCWKGTENTSWDGNLDTETTTCTSSNEHHSIGNYYNWTAALAMNDSSAYGSTFGQNANQSICPAGWTLPKGGVTDVEYSALAPDNQFYPLLNNYLSGATWNGTYWNNATISQIYNSPLYFVMGGGWNGISSHVASGGFYWSSTVYSTFAALDGDFAADGDVSVGAVRSRYEGVSVRCVAR